MILYSVTVNIDQSVHEEWLKWMKQIHIPDVMKTGKFVENRLCRMITELDNGGVTYNIQYVCNDMVLFEEYERDFAENLREEHNAKFRDKFVAFRTLLEIID